MNISLILLNSAWPPGSGQFLILIGLLVSYLIWKSLFGIINILRQRKGEEPAPVTRSALVARRVRNVAFIACGVCVVIAVPDSDVALLNVALWLGVAGLLADFFRWVFIRCADD